MNNSEDWVLNKKLADDWWELMAPIILKQQENEKSQRRQPKANQKHL